MDKIFQRKLQGDLAKALSIVAVAFVDSFDKAGKPYFEHCYQVMINLASNDVELKIIAILHDLIEDTDWTIEALRTEGFTERVLEALALMTRDHNDQSDAAYDVYIRKIATNYDAIRVKKADLKHNSDLTRLKGVREKDLQRICKYVKSYNYLDEKEQEFREVFSKG